MSILSRARIGAASVGLAAMVIVAACSSAATPAPTPTPTPAPTPTSIVTPSPATGSAPAVSATPNSTGNDFITPSPSTGAALTAPPGTPLLVDPFTSAGIATTVDTTAHVVDPSTYRTTIPGTQYQTVYVVFALKPDAVGKVSMEMTLGDVDVLAKPLEIDYGTANSWGDFKVNFPSDGIPTGVYKAVITFEPTGVQVIQYFAVN